MKSYFGIDNDLIKKALKTRKHRTKKEAITITIASIEYIQHQKQLKIISLFGKIDYDKHYDYKKARQC